MPDSGNEFPALPAPGKPASVVAPGWGYFGRLSRWLRLSKGALSYGTYHWSAQTPSFPSDRYTTSNPLRREAGLRLLTATLSAPLKALILGAWRRPYLFSGQETPLAVQSAQRQRPDLTHATVQTVSWVTLTELEVARRVLEAPLANISRMTRNTTLVAQGAYLRLLYATLVRRMGEAGALAEFARLIARVG